jgi:xanthine dehydrogenase YagS FAD-binding subunit
MLPIFAYTRPASVAEAVKALAGEGACALAGGSDLLGCLRDQVVEPRTLVSLGALRELRGITEMADGGLRIGALTTIAEIAAHEAVRRRYTALAEAAAAVGTPQLRNQGTIGGNLCQKPRCWYFRGGFDCLRRGGDVCFALAGENRYHCLFGGDPCYRVHPSDPAAALLALGAQLRLAGAKGSRPVPLEGFHVLPSEDVQRETRLEPGELLAEVLLPAPLAGLRSTYRKVRTRAAWDFALVGAAVALVLDAHTVRSARIALSGVAPVPWRAKPAEAALVGHVLDAATIARAAAAATVGARPLEQNGYKVAVLRGLLEERLTELAATGGARPPAG